MKIERLLGLEVEVNRVMKIYHQCIVILSEFGEERKEEILNETKSGANSSLKVIRPKNRFIRKTIREPAGLKAIELYSVEPLGSFPVIIETEDHYRRAVIGKNLKTAIKTILHLERRKI